MRANVDEDMRLFGAFEQHWDRAVRLQAQAERERDPVLVARLTRHAQREYTTADVPLSRMVADPGYDRDDLATFDALAAIRDREEEMPELAGVRVSRNEQLAADAKDKATHLLGIAFVLAASLFFLTLAQLTRQVAARIFGIAGASIGAVAVVLFIVV
ncbi:MAG: hypothetical protein HOQ03_10025 [Thermoleophilia bacterium]|nr:hypothetical protein [Thermoleophilia bacterium]